MNVVSLLKNGKTLNKTSVLLLLIFLLAIADMFALIPGLYHAKLGFVSLIILLPVLGFSVSKIIFRNTIKVWERICLSIVFGTISMMMLGLAINAVLPLFGIAGPLATIPVLASINSLQIFLITVLASYRSIKLQARIPKATSFIKVTPLLLVPLIAAGGAIRITNGGSPVVSIAAIVIIAAVGGYFFFSHSKNDRVYPLVLLSLSFATLLLWSLRSRHVPSTDVGAEYYVMNLALAHSRWAIELFRDPYNACMSITILPVMLAKISHYGGEAIIKLWIPFIFCFIAPTLYQYFKTVISNKLAFIAGFFFATQSIYMYWMPMLARQEIALLLFSSLFLVIFCLDNCTSKSKKTAITLIGFGIILAHYSTAYIVLFVLLVARLAQKVLQKLIKSQSIFGKISYLPSGTFLLLFFIATFCWQLQITYTAGNLDKVVSSTIASLGGGTSTGQSASVQKLFQLNPFNSGSTNLAERLQSYATTEQRAALAQPSRLFYTKDTNNSQDVQVATARNIESSNLFMSKVVNLFNGFISLVVRASLPIGLLVLLIKYRQQNYAYLTFCAGLLVLIALFLLLPSIAVSFNLERLYQTALIILAVPIVLGLSAMVSILRRIRYAETAALMVIVIGYFFYNSGLSTQIAGGNPNAILNNYGYNYDHDYTTSENALAASWLGNFHPDVPTYSDVASIRGLHAYGAVQNVKQTLLPVAIKRDAYVYLSSANVRDNIAFASGLPYTPPKAFLNNQKNSVYNNGEAVIYR